MLTRCLLICLLVPGIAGCGTDLGPFQVVTFEVRRVRLPRQHQQTVAQELVAGTRTLDDVQLKGQVCDFVADLGPETIPVKAVLNGGPGNYNIVYSNASLHRNPELGTCEPPNVPTEILIQSEAGLSEDELSKAGTMEITFGQKHYTAQYRELTIDVVNEAQGTVGCKFQMYATNNADASDDTVIIIYGGYVSVKYRD